MLGTNCVFAWACFLFGQPQRRNRRPAIMQTSAMAGITVAPGTRLTAPITAITAATVPLQSHLHLPPLLSIPPTRPLSEVHPSMSSNDLSLSSQDVRTTTGATALLHMHTLGQQRSSMGQSHHKNHSHL
jgi:hypothetical protein